MKFSSFATLFLQVLFIATAVHASGGELIWARSAGGSSGDVANGIAVDNSGNVYTTGYFQGTVDFDPGAGVFNLTSAGGTDIFVQKLDASGNFVWARRMGGTDTDIGFSVVVDGSGNVFTTGYFTDTADFDPGPGTLNLTSAGGLDIFVHKLDSSGNLAWAHRIGASSGDIGRGIALDAAGNVFVAGRFQSIVDFDPGAGVFNLTSAGGADIFVLKLNNDGNFIWARSVGGTSSNHDEANAIAVDSMGDAYTTGFFHTTVDFNPGVGTFELTSLGGSDVFVQKLDNSGDHVGTVRTGGAFDDIGFAIALDASGNIYTTGYFRGIVDFDPGAGVSNLTSSGESDIFVQKLNGSGELVWARRMGGSGQDIGFGIAVDASGNVFTTGYFENTVDFDPGAGVFNLSSSGSVDIFVQKLDASGNLLWAKRVGSSSNDQANAIALDSAGDVHIAGNFSSTVDFDPGPGTFNLSSTGGADIFVLKLSSTDITPPNAISVLPGLSGPTNASSITFTVTFDEGVQNVNAASDFVISHSGTANTGVNVSGGPTVYSVQVTGITGDGSFTLAASTLSDVQDLAGNPLASSVTSTTVLIDNTPPSVSIGTPVGSPVNSAGTATFPVTISGANSINLLPGNVSLLHSGTGGGVVSVLNGTTANPQVQVSGVIGNGTYTITIGSGVASDTAGNLSPASSPSSPVTVDNLPPGVTIGAPAGSPVNSAGTATLPVTISGASSINLLPGNVSLQHSGTAGGVVNVLNGTTASPQVQVSGVTGDGSYTITIGSGIASDAAGNLSLASSPSSPVTVDNTPPGVIIGAPVGSPVNSTAMASFPVIISGASSINLLPGNVSLQHSGTAGGMINVLNGTTATALVQVSGVTGDGSYTITINSGIASDTAGNLSPASSPSSPVAVDNTPPGVIIGAPVGSPANSAATASFPVIISGASSINLLPGNISLQHSGTAGGVINVLNGTTATALVQVSGVTGDGSYTVTIDSGIASDTAGNLSPASSPSSPVTVDNTPPGFINLMVTPDEASSGTTIVLSFLASEPIAGDPDVSVNGHPAAFVNDAPFSYTYTVSPLDPSGLATILIGGLDLAGNPGMTEDTTTLNILDNDSTLPISPWPVLPAILAAALLVQTRRRR